MSKSPEHENGTYGANTANATPGVYDTHGGIQPADGPEASPNVYHPTAEPSPAYAGYTDPAAAHGWEGNAYDETTELPPVVDGAGGARGSHGADGAYGADGGYDYVYEDGYDYGDDDGYDAGRGGRRSHRGRHQPGVWRSRRVAVAAGAVAAVSAAALIAGFSLAGSSSEGGTQGKDDRTSPTAGDPVVPTAGTSAAPRSSDGTESSRIGSPGASAGPSASDDDTTDKPEKPEPSPSTTTTAPSTTTPPPSDTDDKPGKGLGNTKRPR